MATKTVAPAEEEVQEAAVLEEGTDPETGRDRNSSRPLAGATDQPISLLDDLNRRRAAIERERDGYEAAGKKERVKACDAELKRLDADIKAASKELETTDGDGPDETA